MPSKDIKPFVSEDEVARYYARRDRNTVVCIHCGRLIKVEDGEVEERFATTKMKNCRICREKHDLDPNEELVFFLDDLTPEEIGIEVDELKANKGGA